jgi:hypothetical protein
MERHQVLLQIQEEVLVAEVVQIKEMAVQALSLSVILVLCSISQAVLLHYKVLMAVGQVMVILLFTHLRLVEL